MQKKQTKWSDTPSYPGETGFNKLVTQPSRRGKNLKPDNSKKARYSK